MVNRSVIDVNHRKRNIVVSRHWEREGWDDGDLFSAFCWDNLNVKPKIAYNGTLRLGKVVEGKPRRLLVRLESEPSAAKLHSWAKNLRKSDDRYVADNVYINPDLTIEEAKLAYERRQKRRQHASSNIGSGPVQRASQPSRSPTGPPLNRTISYRNSGRYGTQNPRSNPQNLIVCSAENHNLPLRGSSTVTAVRTGSSRTPW